MNDQPQNKSNIKISLRDQSHINILSLVGLILIGLIYGFLFRSVGLSSSKSAVSGVVLGLIYTALVVRPAYKKALAKNFPDGQYKTKLDAVIDKIKGM